MNQNPTSNTAWEQQLDWFKDSSQYTTLDTIDGEPMEFEWNTLQLVQEVQQIMNKMSDPEQFQGRIIFMSMFNDITWRSEDNEKECSANNRTLVIPRTWIRSKVVFYLQRMSQGEWDRVAARRLRVLL